MFNCGNLVNAVKSVAKNVTYQQTRNTFVLKRHYPFRLYEKGGRNPKMSHQNFIYRLVENQNLKPRPIIPVILTENVDEFGLAGQVINVKTTVAYKKLLLPGLAVYHTPKNIERYKKDEAFFKMDGSTLSALKTRKYLSKKVLYLNMSAITPWVLEPWHLRVAFRQSLLEVPEYAIELPEGEIKGPDMSLEDKEFYVVVTINKKEKVNVRCRIYHQDNKIRSPIPQNFWNLRLEPMFSEQKEGLDNIYEALNLEK